MDHTCRTIPETEVEMSDEMYIPGLPIKISLLQWDKGVLPEHDDPELAPCALRMVSEALARDEDPLLDNEYPEFIRFIVKCMRISRNTWG